MTQKEQTIPDLKFIKEYHKHPPETQKDKEEALDIACKAWEECVSLYGPRHPICVSLLNIKIGLLICLGKSEQAAEDLWEQMLL